MDFPHVKDYERMEILRSGEHIYSHKKVATRRMLMIDGEKKKPKKEMECVVNSKEFPCFFHNEDYLSQADPLMPIIIIFLSLLHKYWK